MNATLAVALAAFALLLGGPILKAARDAAATGRAATHIEDSERANLMGSALALLGVIWWHQGWPYNAGAFLLALFCAILGLVLLRISLVSLLCRLFKAGPASKSSRKTANPADDS